MLSLLLAGIFLSSWVQVRSEHAWRQFEVVGCYRDKLQPERALRKLYHNVRGNIPWGDLTQVVDRCASKALRKGIKVFGIQFWGECFTDDDAISRYDMYREVVRKKAKKCIEFQSSTHAKTLGVGGSRTNYVYRFVPCAVPWACGCGRCLKIGKYKQVCACRPGSTNQIRFDFSSPCVDINECLTADCGKTGICVNKHCSGYECRCESGEHVDKDNPRSKCSDCGIKPELRKGIVGGKAAVAAEWPWMISFRFNGDHFCGAALISEDWAITAAHCYFEYTKLRQYSVLLGALDFNNPSQDEQTLALAKFIPHPKYDSIVIDYDVALIKFATKARFTNSTKPVCLIEKNANFPPGTDCYVTGWGYLTERGPSSDILQYVKVPLVSNDVCRPAVRPYDLTDRMLCAGYPEGKKDSCSGDSGGPLVCQKDKLWYLVGDVSWGVGCARPMRYGVYGDISVFRQWILDTMASN